MLVDRENTVSKEQALTATAVSTDVVDLSAAPTDLFGGSPECNLVVVVEETFVSGGSSTLVIDVVDDDNTSLSSPAVLASSPSIAKAALVAGAKFAIPVPPNLGATSGRQRYIGARYTVGTANFTAGKLTAFFTNQVQSADTVLYANNVVFAS